MIRLRTALAALAFGALLGCSSSTGGSGPGTLQAQLITPQGAGADGAVMFVLSGPSTVSNLRAAAGDTLWTAQPAATVDTVVVTGPLAAGTVVTFDVPDIGVKTQYIATVLQVASSSDYSLRSLVNYNINVVQ